MKIKPIILIVSILLLLAGSLAFVQEVTYSPLTEKEFKNLFPNYDSGAKKKYSVDFIGLSLHGELFDMFLYELTDMTIDSCHPNIRDDWTSVSMSDGIAVSSWQRIPMDSSTNIRCKDALDLVKNKDDKRYTTFITELSNPLNYYSYLYVNELEYYFFLYCFEKHHLYYVRKRGW